MNLLEAKAILFDMDGVIFDSMPDHAKAWKDAFKNIGIDFSEYQVYLQEGRTGSDTVNDVFLEQKGRAATKEEIRSIYENKCELFQKYGETKPMPYMDKLLNELKDRGYIIGIVTGSGQKSLLTTLDYYYPGIFTKERIVSAFDVKNGKPNPEPYLKGLEKTGVAANEAVVIENAPFGIKAAKAAGIYTIGVNTGILEKQALIDAGADALFDSVEALYSSLLKNNL